MSKIFKKIIFSFFIFAFPLFSTLVFAANSGDSVSSINFGEYASFGSSTWQKARHYDHTTLISEEQGYFVRLYDGSYTTSYHTSSNVFVTSSLATTILPEFFNNMTDDNNIKSAILDTNWSTGEGNWVSSSSPGMLSTTSYYAGKIAVPSSWEVANNSEVFSTNSGWFWTRTPNGLNSNNMIEGNSPNSFYNWGVSGNSSVRPSLRLASNSTIISGTGTSEDPYVLNGNPNAPAIIIDSPNTNITLNSGVLTISGTIKDINVGEILTVSATISGVLKSTEPIIADGNQQPWSLSWDHNQLTQGQYQNISFSVTDGEHITTAPYLGTIFIGLETGKKITSISFGEYVSFGGSTWQKARYYDHDDFLSDEQGYFIRTNDDNYTSVYDSSSNVFATSTLATSTLSTFYQNLTNTNHIQPAILDTNWSTGTSSWVSSSSPGTPATTSYYSSKIAVPSSWEVANNSEVFSTYDDYYWTRTPRNSTDNSYVFSARRYANFTYNSFDDELNIRPSIRLATSSAIISGVGTNSDPYLITGNPDAPIITINSPHSQITINSGYLIISGNVRDKNVGDQLVISAAINGVNKNTDPIISNGENQPWTLTWAYEELEKNNYENVIFSATDGHYTSTTQYSGTISIALNLGESVGEIKFGNYVSFGGSTWQKARYYDHDNFLTEEQGYFIRLYDDDASAVYDENELNIFATSTLANYILPSFYDDMTNDHSIKNEILTTNWSTGTSTYDSDDGSYESFPNKLSKTSYYTSMVGIPSVWEVAHNSELFDAESPSRFWLRTLVPSSDYYVWSAYSSSSFESYPAYYEMQVVPSLRLSPSAVIVSGAGTSANPYVLGSNSNAPTIAINSPIGDITLNSGNLVITGTVKDINHGDQLVVSATIGGINKSSNIIADGTDQPWSLSWAHEELSKEMYNNFFITVTDGTNERHISYEGLINVVISPGESISEINYGEYASFGGSTWQKARYYDHNSFVSEEQGYYIRLYDENYYGRYSESTNLFNFSTLATTTLPAFYHDMTNDHNVKSAIVNNNWSVGETSYETDPYLDEDFEYSQLTAEESYCSSKIAIPSVWEVINNDEVFNQYLEDERFWLRTPNSSSPTSVFIREEMYLSAAPTNSYYSNYGIRPSLVLSTAQAIVISGAGTQIDPYILGDQNSNNAPSITLSSSTTDINLATNETLTISGTVKDLNQGDELVVSATIGHSQKSTTGIIANGDDQSWSLSWHHSELPEDEYSDIVFSVSDQLNKTSTTYTGLISVTAANSGDYISAIRFGEYVSFGGGTWQKARYYDHDRFELGQQGYFINIDIDSNNYFPYNLDYVSLNANRFSNSLISSHYFPYFYANLSNEHNIKAAILNSNWSIGGGTTPLIFDRPFYYTSKVAIPSTWEVASNPEIFGNEYNEYYWGDEDWFWTRTPVISNSFNSWAAFSSASYGSAHLGNYHIVAPSLKLSSGNVNILSGSGSYDDPYVLANTDSNNAPSITLSSDIDISLGRHEDLIISGVVKDIDLGDELVVSATIGGVNKSTNIIIADGDDQLWSLTWNKTELHPDEYYNIIFSVTDQYDTVEAIYTGSIIVSSANIGESIADIKFGEYAFFGGSTWQKARYYDHDDFIAEEQGYFIREYDSYYYNYYYDNIPYDVWSSAYEASSLASTTIPAFYNEITNNNNIKSAILDTNWSTGENLWLSNSSPGLVANKSYYSSKVAIPSAWEVANNSEIFPEYYSPWFWTRTPTKSYLSVPMIAQSSALFSNYSAKLDRNYIRPALRLAATTKICGGDGITNPYVLGNNTCDSIFTISSSDVNIKVEPDSDLIIRGTVQDGDIGDELIVSATIGGVSKSTDAIIADGDHQSWSLTWSYEELLAGRYQNIDFTVDDGNQTYNAVYTGIITKSANHGDSIAAINYGDYVTFGGNTWQKARYHVYYNHVSQEQGYFIRVYDDGYTSAYHNSSNVFATSTLATSALPTFYNNMTNDNNTKSLILPTTWSTGANISYQQYWTSYIAIPSAWDVENNYELFSDSTTNRFWLRTPSTTSSYARYAQSYSYTYSTAQVNYSYRVRPSLRLSVDNGIILSGSGTSDDPYVLGNKHSDPGVSTIKYGDYVSFGGSTWRKARYYNHTTYDALEQGYFIRLYNDSYASQYNPSTSYGNVFATSVLANSTLSTFYNNMTDANDIKNAILNTNWSTRDANGANGPNYFGQIAIPSSWEVKNNPEIYSAATSNYFWTRTPTIDSSTSVAVAQSTATYNSNSAVNVSNRVMPSLRLSSYNTTIISGTGTNSDPYVLASNPNVPTIEITSPAENIALSSGNLTISGYVTDVNIGDELIVSAAIDSVSKSTTPILTNGGQQSWSLTWSYEELSKGEYTNIVFNVTDGTYINNVNYVGKISVASAGAGDHISKIDYGEYVSFGGSTWRKARYYDYNSFASNEQGYFIRLYDDNYRSVYHSASNIYATSNIATSTLPTFYDNMSNTNNIKDAILSTRWQIKNYWGDESLDYFGQIAIPSYWEVENNPEIFSLAASNRFWTRTPATWSGIYYTNQAMSALSSSSISYYEVNNSYRILPSLKLSVGDTVIISGSGTASNPYILGYNRNSPHIILSDYPENTTVDYNLSITISGTVQDANLGDELIVSATIGGINKSTTPIIADGNNQSWSLTWTHQELAGGPYYSNIIFSVTDGEFSSVDYYDGTISLGQAVVNDPLIAIKYGDYVTFGGSTWQKARYYNHDNYAPDEQGYFIRVYDSNYTGKYLHDPNGPKSNDFTNSALNLFTLPQFYDQMSNDHNIKAAILDSNWSVGGISWGEDDSIWSTSSFPGNLKAASSSASKISLPSSWEVANNSEIFSTTASSSFWTRTPIHQSWNEVCVAKSKSDFNIHFLTSRQLPIRPSVKLSTDITILAGDGSSDDPYILKNSHVNNVPTIEINDPNNDIALSSSMSLIFSGTIQDANLGDELVVSATIGGVSKSTTPIIANGGSQNWSLVWEYQELPPNEYNDVIIKVSDQYDSSAVNYNGTIRVLPADPGNDIGSIKFGECVSFGGSTWQKARYFDHINFEPDEQGYFIHLYDDNYTGIFGSFDFNSSTLISSTLVDFYNHFSDDHNIKSAILDTNWSTGGSDSLGYFVDYGEGGIHKIVDNSSSGIITNIQHQAAKIALPSSWEVTNNPEIFSSPTQNSFWLRTLGYYYDGEYESPARSVSFNSQDMNLVNSTVAMIESSVQKKPARMSFLASLLINQVQALMGADDPNNEIFEGRWVAQSSELFNIKDPISSRRVRPSLRLSSEVVIISGDGTLDNPYVLGSNANNAPSIQISSPNADVVLESGSLTISGMIQDANLGDELVVSATIGGVSKSTTSIIADGSQQSWSLSWNFDELPLGQYSQIPFIVSDGSSTNTAIYAETITIGKNVPLILINDPTTSYIVVNDTGITISGIIKNIDAGKAHTVFATIGGVYKSTTLLSPSDNASWQLSWSYNQLPAGNYSNITFSVSDGNKQASNNYLGEIIVDKTAPSLSFKNTSHADSPYSIADFDDIDYPVSAQDNISGLRSFYYQWSNSIDDPQGISSSECSQGNTVIFNSGTTHGVYSTAAFNKPDSEGKHYLHVCVVDLAGNINKSHTIYHLELATTASTENLAPPSFLPESSTISEPEIEYVSIEDFSQPAPTMTRKNEAEDVTLASEAGSYLLPAITKVILIISPWLLLIIGLISMLFPRSSGLVYDSRTKKAIPNALVAVIQEGKFITASFTNQLGIYSGFKLNSGEYQLIVNSPSHTFPSIQARAIGQNEKNHYLGEKFYLNSSGRQVINYYIPLDIDQLGNDADKRLILNVIINYFIRFILLIANNLHFVWVLGFIISILLVTTNFNWFSLLTLIVFIIGFFRKVIIKAKKPNIVGKLINEDGSLAIGVTLLLHFGNNQQVIPTITNEQGQFTLLAKPNQNCFITSPNFNFVHEQKVVSTIEINPSADLQLVIKEK